MTRARPRYEKLATGRPRSVQADRSLPAVARRRRGRAVSILLASLLALLLPPTTLAAPHPDFPAARTAAQASGRDIAVLYLGTDWSEPSRRFEQTVLADPQVAADLTGFELLRIDQREQPTEADQQLAKRNKDLKLSVWNFPAVALLDREGRAVSLWTGLGRETPAGLRARLAAGRRQRDARDVAWAKAHAASGIEKARLLGLGLTEVQEDLVRGSYDKVLKEMKALDPDDAAGYQRRYNFRMNAFVEGTLEPLWKEKQFEEALAKVDTELRNPAYTLEQRQQLLGGRFQVLRRWERKQEAEAALHEIIKLNPTNHMGVGARGYLKYLNDPVVVTGEWAGEHARPWYHEWRMDVSGIVTQGGVYTVKFLGTGGNGLQVSNVCLVVGNEIVDRVSDGRGRNEFRVQTGIERPGPKVQLIMHTKSGGWLDTRGRIEITREDAGPPLL